jgi:dTDP-4-dehydrorhamnose reductase
MKILLFGGGGQVGTELRRALAPIGEIVAPPRDAVDLARSASIVDAIEKASPDIIVNAAAYTAVDRAEDEPETTHAVNAAAVATMAREAARRNIWLVHYSTDYVFDGRKPAAYVESDIVNPLNVYGASKLAGERAIAESGARHVILRASWVYSAHGTNFVKTILELARARDALRVVSDQHGAPTSAGRIAEVTAVIVARLFCEKGDIDKLSGIYHLAPAGETNWHAFARAVLSQAILEGATLRASPESVTAIRAANYATKAMRPMNSRLDTGKLRRAFAVSLPDWREDLPRVVREIIARERS